MQATGLEQPDNSTESASEQLSELMDPLTADAAAEWAVSNSPQLAELVAQRNALQATWLQVGLDTNPEFGYVAAEIGANSQAGQQGVYWGKQFVRGEKLELNRQVVCRRIDALDAQIAVMRAKLGTDARLAAFDLLVLQQRRELLRRFSQWNAEIDEAAENLFVAEEISRWARLQASLLTQNTELLEQQLGVKLTATRAQLATAMNLSRGQQDTNELKVVGSLEMLDEQVGAEATLASILESSPEMVLAQHRLRGQQSAYERALAEQVVDLDFQANFLHDFSSDDELLNLQVTVPLQINNWNQGNIQAAEQQIVAASRGIESAELSIRNRFANTWREYDVARARLMQLEQQLLPNSQEVFELVRQAFAAGESGYLDLINAQQNFLNASLQHNDALGDYWRAVALLDGMLLSKQLD